MSLESEPYNREQKILLVDDDNTLLKFFKIHLNKFFAKVFVVESAKEALAKVKEGEIDLVVSDIRMPKVDGFELLQKIKKVDPSIPVFLVSGALLTEEQKDFISQEVDGFLKKPFSVEEFHLYISRGLQLREIYRPLFAVTRTKKHFMELLKNKVELKDAIKRGSHDEAVLLYEELKKVS